MEGVFIAERRFARKVLQRRAEGSDERRKLWSLRGAEAGQKMVNNKPGLSLLEKNKEREVKNIGTEDERKMSGNAGRRGGLWNVDDVGRGMPGDAEEGWEGGGEKGKGMD